MFGSILGNRVTRGSPRIAIRGLTVFALALCTLGASGCTTVPVAVGNPIPGMTVVAVAPFLNLSAEPSADSRRFAIAYYTELQKTANYEVIPLGIVELAIRENDLDLRNPDDAIKLAIDLHADAVVVGAVTEYSPYYPPQLGMTVRWYSPRNNWVFFPGIGTEDGSVPPNPSGPGCPCPNATSPNDTDLQGIQKGSPVVRGQSTDDDSDRYTPFPDPPPAKLAQGSRSSASGATPAPGSWLSEPETGITNGSSNANGGTRSGQPLRAFCDPSQPDGVQPVMSWTRFFDGADRELIQALKGYYYLKGDTRSGGWQAYLHRSDDFLRFASHMMVVEMMRKHGAPLKTEKVCLYGR